MTPAVATDRLLCAPPCVGTAFCVYHLADVGGNIPRQGPLVRGLTIALNMNIEQDTMMLLGPLHPRSPMGVGG